ncbi:glycosyltransferase family 2 protein [Rikenella microfusus]|uniref:glycosyltransferase family 2 protein n=2 Tax=Rikenella microfusus TaxID=28139 RepID=UPI002354D015|nr:glycosyltransferase family A protein [Rikenella microfusus]
MKISSNTHVSPDLAIVIPAYKGDFLKECLESVFSQTDTGYHVYIFNDASADERIESIVHSFGHRSNLTYLRFDTNMGRESLPGQWNRCIRHIGDERWVWLFCDDDVMDPDCVESFRKAVKNHPDGRLFRFNTIKFRDNVLLRRNELPTSVSLGAWLIGKLEYQFESYVVEYIFDRGLWDDIGGFPDFPLGWCADDWFWIQAMQQTDLITIPESLIYWRHSTHNISGAENDAATAFLKMTACCRFQDEMEATGVFRRYPAITDSFRRWIHAQWKYLSPQLSVEERTVFFRFNDRFP